MLRITDEEAASKTKGRLNRGVQRLLVDDNGTDAAQPSNVNDRTTEVRPIPFERRGTSRLPTQGWAQVICQDPYHTFLGGAMQLADVSDQAVGLIGSNRLVVGELVEVRLAPFRCRGRVGRVVRCDQLRHTRRVPTVRLDRADRTDDHDAHESSDSNTHAKYKVAIHFGRSVIAA